MWPKTWNVWYHSAYENLFLALHVRATGLMVKRSAIYNAGEVLRVPVEVQSLMQRAYVCTKIYVPISGS